MGEAVELIWIGFQMTGSTSRLPRRSARFGRCAALVGELRVADRTTGGIVALERTRLLSRILSGEPPQFQVLPLVTLGPTEAFYDVLTPTPRTTHASRGWPWAHSGLVISLDSNSESRRRKEENR